MTKHKLQTIVLILALLMGAASESWALGTDDIILDEPFTNGTVTVTSVEDNTRLVTLTITPEDGYKVMIGNIIVQKLLDPGNAQALQRTPGITDVIPVLGDDVVIGPASGTYTFTVPEGYDGALVSVTFTSTDPAVVININRNTRASQITDPAGHYKVTEDGVDASVFENLYSKTFTGELDGGLFAISGGSHALFGTVNGGTVKNVILDNVSISSGTNVGAICNEAIGDTRIYNCGVLATGSTANTDENGYTYLTNCSSTISGSNYVGGIVGLLDGSSRVINCFSYAKVSGGTHVGGIVGYNNVATTASNLQTMVMNCIFYGEVSGGSIAPIYNGEIITNVGENIGVSNFNYFRLEASYIQNTDITKVYNCALGAETRFLQRFEFYRHLLNSHRELAAWWATGNYSNKDEMAKWVLEPAQIGTSTPYPILKVPGKYPSVVNIDAENAPTTTERNMGGKLGTLSVTIQSGSGEVFSAPTGASITKPSLELNITDKDFDHFNFNYYKVQLPYYNEVGTGNYTGNRVVTGWKITSITGGTPGDFKEEDSDKGYNFADRNCTNKDLYGVSHRVFNQGAYWDVPEGVTAITIQPYWAKAAYVADAYPDVVYSEDMKTSYNVPNVGGGQKYTNNTNYVIAGEQQKVFTTIKNAVENANGLNKPTSNSVNDYAVVLVGNVHQYTTNNQAVGSSYKYTVTSIDLDGDNEPDYSFMLRNDGRNPWHPVKWDFINIPGLGMAQKSTGAAAVGSYNLGIVVPTNWFETTNTSLFRVTQFEYERSQNHTTAAPYILQGGVMEQWVTGQQDTSPNNITYFHVGGNVWFKEFHRGVHQDRTAPSNHPPVSVTGGDFDKFYLTGLYRADVTSYGDNAECYINGGRFGEVAGAAMEGIGNANGADDTGNITWQIQNADIKEFYGGGLNADSPVTGNISTTITGGKIDLFCGGPKFGDMSTDKTVITTATGCEFGTFFGAGYGGSSYSRRAPRNIVNMINMPATTGDSKSYDSWTAWVKAEYKQKSATNFPGISTRFDYQFIPNSGNADNVGRLFVEHVLFSLAKTYDVTSTLTNCTITGNFYGGGSLGMVDGPVTSTLTNCNVLGNVFGGGYSASLPTVEVDSIGFRVDPYYYTDLGTYRTGVKGKTTTYKWAHGETIGINKTDSILYTTENLDGLGVVTGKVTLTINGNTVADENGEVMTVGKSVYGGGEESGVDGDTEITISGGTIGTPGKGGALYGNVYGGGFGSDTKVRAGLVKGNTKVTIQNTGSGDNKVVPTILHNVYGGGAYGSVGTYTYASEADDAAITGHTSGGTTEIYIKGGIFGSNGSENGMIFGSSRGDVGAEGAIHDRLAWVYDTKVYIGTSGSASDFTTPVIKGSVYGGGENGHNYHDAEVNIYSGTIGIPTGETIGDYTGAYYPYRGNVYGGGCGTDTYKDGTQDKYNPLAGIVQGTAAVNITGGYIVHNVYGAGAMGSVGTDTDENSGKTTINISGGRIGYDGNRNGNVFGAARGEYGISIAGSGLANVRETEVNLSYATTPTADNEGKTEQLITGSVFGGGESGTVKESVAVNMTGGLILKDVYGGGALADTQTSNWDATKNSNVGGWADGKSSASATTTVRLTGGRIGEEVFGGGLGEAGTTQNPTGKPAYVWGDVLLDLNGTTPIDGTTHKPSTTGTAITSTTGCVVGQVFGCNNVNGTPKGDVMVHVYATQNAAATQIANTPAVEASGDDPAVPAVEDAKVPGRYDVEAVYGGGNQAAYNPVTPYDGTAGSKTQVIIEGCSLTSIETVYGGGNAAAVPETNVDIKGAYEIGYLFGGGNGKDDIAPGVENPGADVGTLDHGTTAYGTGNANTLMEGGLIHEAYGGSNQKGIIKGSINQITDPKEPTDPAFCCELAVEKIVGAGKYADIDGDVNMTLSCQPNRKVNELFAGADEANVNGNITLNITNGHFGKVFGGNNLGGAVKGKITVNVEETECQPIKIDNLYLGGNKAAYSVFGYYESEDIHPVTLKKILKPRESEDDTHTPVENPATDDTHSFPYAQPELNIISCTYIGNVFGGGLGKEAKMYANPTVNVNMVAGAHATTAVPAMMEELHLDVTKTAANPDKLGIIRNVYGGGDAADIEGNTTVNIATEEGKSAYIIGSVFGGGNAADVLGNTNVTMSGGYVFNGIFGGGYAGNVGTFIERSYTEKTDVGTDTEFDHSSSTHTCIGKPTKCKTGTGKCTVVVDGGQIGPISVATQGMNRSKADGGPVPEGWVWGAGQGLVEDPAEHPDTHFSSYVGSTDVTIGGTALVMESIIGGGEFGRVLGNTLVKIEGGQIGVGANQTETVGGVLRPKRYAETDFVNPLTTTITDANALTECSHYPYGKVIEGKKEYLPYDPYYEDYPAYVAAHPEYGPASTSNPSDGKTWIGCVFAGGSGYMPFKNTSGYDWVRSAGLVEGDSEVRISGGHILTNVYGGNEVTDVKGKSIVKMTGGTIGVPRTLEQIANHPLSCYLFGAGKGDDRPHFYEYTNVGSVEVEVSGGIIYGSVFGGSEDGHVTGDINLTIKKGDSFTIGSTTYNDGPIIGTWGTSYVDGNVFGAGRGFSGNTLTAGNVGGNVTLNIEGGTILGSVYGGMPITAR